MRVESCLRNVQRVQWVEFTSWCAEMQESSPSFDLSSARFGNDVPRTLSDPPVSMGAYCGGVPSQKASRNSTLVDRERLRTPPGLRSLPPSLPFFNIPCGLPEKSHNLLRETRCVFPRPCGVSNIRHPLPRPRICSKGRAKEPVEEGLAKYCAKAPGLKIGQRGRCTARYCKGKEKVYRNWQRRKRSYTQWKTPALGSATI